MILSMVDLTLMVRMQLLETFKRCYLLFAGFSPFHSKPKHRMNDGEKLKMKSVEAAKSRLLTMKKLIDDCHRLLFNIRCGVDCSNRRYQHLQNVALNGLKGMAVNGY